MKWTDIEAKWDAMTRRVQSDRPRDQDTIVTTPASDQPSLPLNEVSDQRAPSPLDRPAN